MAVEHPVILFDGVCNFCNSAVNFIIRQDKKGIFRFAPLQSKVGQQLSEYYHISAKDMDSFVFIYKGKAYQKSAAALKLSNLLPWYWKWTQVFRMVPKFFRDGVYDTVAKNRYQWFGKREICSIPTPELQSRFLT